MRKRKKKRRFLFLTKKRKLIFTNPLFWLVLSFLIVFFGIFYLVCFCEVFQIKKIETENFFFDRERVSSLEVKKLVEKRIQRNIFFFPTKSIFLANLDQIEKEILEKFKRVKEVEIKRKFPDEISIQIYERKPAVFFCQQEKKCAILDKEGKIIELISPTSSLSLVKIEGIFHKENNFEIGEEILKKEELEKILTIEKEIDSLFEFKIEKFQPSKEKLIAFTNEGWKIFFNLKEDILPQIFNLGVIINKKYPSSKEREKIEYIDLRFGEKVYLKEESF